MNHTQIGDITEYKFVVYCLEHNIPISKPVNNNMPYDFIIDINNTLLKVQVKTGYDCVSSSSFVFNTRSTSKNYNECTMKNYVGKIDGFIVWYKEIPNKFLYIPVNKAKKSMMRIYYGDNPTSIQNSVDDYDFDKLI